MLTPGTSRCPRPPVRSRSRFPSQVLSVVHVRSPRTRRGRLTFRQPASILRPAQRYFPLRSDQCVPTEPGRRSNRRPSTEPPVVCSAAAATPIPAILPRGACSITNFLKRMGPCRCGLTILSVERLVRVPYRYRRLCCMLRLDEVVAGFLDHPALNDSVMLA